MTLVGLNGVGLWMPTTTPLYGGVFTQAGNETMLLDFDEEEGQCIGTVTIDGGGSKTFGTSSKIGWLAGTAIAFVAGGTLTIGIKRSTRISTTAGPPARASVGAATFDMSCALVGGTHTIASLTWREDTMTTGTPFTVNDGDLLAICFHLNVTGGAQSIKVRHSTSTGSQFSGHTLVTSSGATFTRLDLVANLVLLFDDGTLGWVEPSKVYTVADTSVAPTVGNTVGNVFRVPFPCQIDTLAILLSAAAGTDTFTIGLYATPLTTPVLLTSVAGDGNITWQTIANFGNYIVRVPTPQTLAADTDYAVGLTPTAGTITTRYYETAALAYFKADGMAGTCYGALRTGSGAFVAETSGLRRYRMFVRVSALDDGAGGALLSLPPQRQHVHTLAAHRAALF